MSKALTTKSLNAKVLTFAKLKEKRQQVKELSKELDEKYNQLREELRLEMSERKVLTLKTEDYTLYRAKRNYIRIADEDKVSDWFVKRGLVLPTKVDYYGALPAIKQALNEGKTVKGVEEEQSEYVSVRINKPTKKGGE